MEPGVPHRLLELRGKSFLRPALTLDAFQAFFNLLCAAGESAGTLTVLPPAMDNQGKPREGGMRFGLVSWEQGTPGLDLMWELLMTVKCVVLIYFLSFFLVM